MDSPKADQELYERLDRDMKALRDRCRSATSRRLGLAIALSQKVRVSWAPDNRALLEEHRGANPKGVDVRPLLCVAYSAGVNYVHPVVNGKKFAFSPPDAPQPEKALEVARAILQDRPDDAIGHFYVGRAQFQLDHRDLAMGEIRTALESHRLPPVFERVARTFLANPRPAAFVVKIAY